MITQIGARTLRAHQVKQKLINRGFDCIRIVGGSSNCTSIWRYLSRHNDAVFIPTVINNIFVMIKPNKLTYILEARKEEE